MWEGDQTESTRAFSLVSTCQVARTCWWSPTNDGVPPNPIHFVCVLEGFIIPPSKTFDWFLCHCWCELFTNLKALLRQLWWLICSWTCLVLFLSGHFQYFLAASSVVALFRPWALRSLHEGLLVVPRISKSRMGGRALCYQAPLLWNHLPMSVRGADTLSLFKSRLKTFLFDKAYS